MVIDAFPFFNELELLEIRLAELAPIVDKFLLVEATQTFTGKPKPLYFQLNKDRFAQYPIEHVVIDPHPPDVITPWQRENYPRHVMRDRLCAMGLSPADIVLLSDLDEIPRADVVARCLRTLPYEVPRTVYVLEQALSYYFVNCRADEPWRGTRMTRWGDIGNMQALREAQGVNIPNAGWHFSYIGGVQRIQEKIGAWAHTEYDRPEFTNAEHVARCLAEGTDVFDRGFDYRFFPLDGTYPAFLRENADRFAHLIGEIPQEVEAKKLYQKAVATPSDISEHLPYLYRLASTVEHVTEMGTRTAQSTSAFVYAAPERIVAYDLERSSAVKHIEHAAQQYGVNFTFHEQDVLKVEIEETDLLFLDTWHVEQQVREELRLHASKARRYIVFHDTQTYADLGETLGMRGIWPAISDFLRANPEWHILEHFPNNNGLTVLTRDDTQIVIEEDHADLHTGQVAPINTLGISSEESGAASEGVCLGIVVAVRNCLPFTQDMIRSIRTRDPYKVYVVDDRSDAPVKEWLHSRSDIVSFIDPPMSTGVAYNWNVGIAAALADGCTHFLVANNDIVFHPQTIDLMVERIDRGDVALVTAHDVGGTYRDPAQVMALLARIDGEDGSPEFSCLMMKEPTIRHVGWFDEGFEGAYFEDHDYHGRIAMAGLKAIRLLNAPVFHHGTATIRSNENVAQEIGQAAQRNKERFVRKWGRLPAGNEQEMRRTYFPVPFNDQSAQEDVSSSRLRELLGRELAIRSDIRGHLDFLYRLGSSVQRITELSPGGSRSTCAFLRSRPQKMRVYEPVRAAHLSLVEGAARLADVDFRWIRAEAASQPIEATDLLFIDTWHVEEQMRRDLRLHGNQAERYIVLHDTQTFDLAGETKGHRGIWPAVSEFLRDNPHWSIHQHYFHNNGLTVLRRRPSKPASGETA